MHASAPALLLLWCCVWCCAWCCVCGCAATSARAGGSADAVRAVLERQEAAWNAGDLEGFLAAGYHESPELTFLSGGDWQRGYGEVLERYRRRYRSEGAAMGQLAFDDLEIVELAPGAALARGRWRLDHADGRTSGGLFTLILRRMENGWRIVHDHTSSG